MIVNKQRKEEKKFRQQQKKERADTLRYCGDPTFKHKRGVPVGTALLVKHTYHRDPLRTVLLVATTTVLA